MTRFVGSAAVRRASALVPVPRSPHEIVREAAEVPPAPRTVAYLALVRRAQDVDRLLADALRPVALPVLRVLLGLLFVWFGALKILGASPVEELVAGTVPWVDADLLVPALGGVEVVLGLGLLTGILLRLVLPVLAAHLAGTFLTFVMLPGVMFRKANPVLLTADGEFVMKNLVLISAAVVLMAHADGARWSGARS